MSTTLSQAKIAFVGAGSMSEAIIRGLIQTKVANPQNVYVMNRSDQDRLAFLRSEYGLQATSDPAVKETFLREADVVVLCMKPKDVVTAFADLQPLLNEGQLLVSVIAGLSIAKIEALLESNMPIARTMPNTSSTIGLGATGMSFSTKVNDTFKQLATQMFEAVGIVSIVEEEKLEILTGVSGSGPAYVYYFMEAMIKAGIEGGLTEEDSRQLTLQTVLGAAHMVQHTQEDPAELRRKVTSPNGATQASIEMLDRYQFTEAVAKAVFRSAERAKEMGEQIAAPSPVSKLS
ncbi:pyrroline-5-carboxylate reductase [Paenibacillus aceris]|uniref:Pyrroline-5-carboxylate reductase n=1 Tax=Paenibacillus aceris TaxID=869555 RepID=A0ABS4HTG4_9BACL|nr:pyrroline-5-carboxylate reductase [Paenibacillus aceris]MBP1961908.1 pyrroline-5-carboxylate reductase [Paenibacillus aceris]NHW34241.1 pyrroline-5-carboxylate reductase [Paenibacillus aceris]